MAFPNLCLLSYRGQTCHPAFAFISRNRLILMKSDLQPLTLIALISQRPFSVLFIVSVGSIFYMLSGGGAPSAAGSEGISRGIAGLKNRIIFILFSSQSLNLSI
jgi:hypothetical protein